MTTKDAPTSTTAGGNPVADNQNSLTAGPRGPVLLADYHLVEKMAHFNRERIPERVVHAKGSAAYGTLTITQDITGYTRAKLFSTVGKKTDLLLRFSTVAGERGAADAERDVRGFAIKFYTEEGNWDLVGNNTPVFFVRDPLKFSDFIHTQKRDPQTNLRSPTAMWDFWSLSPESLHQVTILFSDRGLPKSYRHMHGFGSHTYSFINASERALLGEVPLQDRCRASRTTTNAEARRPGRRRTARRISATCSRPSSAATIPKWRMMVQVMPEQDAETYHLNPFDLTKVWPHKDYPLIEVGILELNRNPENYFAEVEQAAFAPSNIVPGIGHSPDKMLQARDLLLRRRAPLSPGRQSRQPAGQPAALPGPHLPPRRPHARRRQRRRQRRTTSPTASAGRSNRPPTASRRCASPATPTATIIAPATTTTARPARSSG